MTGDAFFEAPARNEDPKAPGEGLLRSMRAGDAGLLLTDCGLGRLGDLSGSSDPRRDDLLAIGEL